MLERIVYAAHEYGEEVGITADSLSECSFPEPFSWFSAAALRHEEATLSEEIHQRRARLHQVRREMRRRGQRR